MFHLVLRSDQATSYSTIHVCGRLQLESFNNGNQQRHSNTVIKTGAREECRRLLLNLYRALTERPKSISEFNIGKVRSSDDASDLQVPPLLKRALLAEREWLPSFEIVDFFLQCINPLMFKLVNSWNLIWWTAEAVSFFSRF